MTIDEVILSKRLSDLRLDELLTEIRLTNVKTDSQREIARCEARLEELRYQIAEVEPKLYWERMQELLHTPCWRYRVSA
jgi:hypothetical protein